MSKKSNIIKVMDEDYNSSSDSEYLPNEDEMYCSTSSQSDECSYDTENEEESDVNNKVPKFDEVEYQKMLCKMFPSKYMKDKVNSSTHKDKNKLIRLKKKTNKDETTISDTKKNKTSSKKRDIKKELVSETETSDEEEDEILDTSDDEDDDEKSKSFNIVFTIKPSNKNQYSDEDDDEDDDEEEEEEEEEEEDEHEEEEEGDQEDDEDEEELNKRKKKQKKENVYDDIDSDTEETFLNIIKTLKGSKEKENIKEECMKKFNKYVDKARKKREERKRVQELKKKKENIKKMKKMIFSNKEMNDYKYFKQLDLEKQEELITKMKDIEKEYHLDRPYHMSLIDSTLPVQYKAIAMKKVNVLKQMEPGSNEYYKIKQWVDTFMRIPFGVYRSLPVSINDGLDICHDFMENSKKILDDAVYGLNDAKLQILQHLGNLITNPSAVGSAIAIKGPMGTGKTTLVKEGISKILKRPFEFIALGGATDSSYLEGHSYTYEGSIWGKIVEILIRSKCMNPVIYFDELDKVSDTPRGEEIVGILTHLTDTTQNTQFHDKYFSDIDFDLSKALFIFSYNHEEKINPILKDRMYRIQTKGYNTKDKIIIAKTHLIPKIERNIGFKQGDIIMTDEILEFIIQHVEDEKGVRNLKRCLEIIFSKINLYRLMKPDSVLFDNVKTIEFKFPLTLTQEIINKLIQKKDIENESFRFMYS